MLTQWICVLSRVGGFRLGKLVSILSNENKQMEVVFTNIHNRCEKRYMENIVLKCKYRVRIEQLFDRKSLLSS